MEEGRRGEKQTWNREKKMNIRKTDIHLLERKKIYIANEDKIYGRKK